MPTTTAVDLRQEILDRTTRARAIADQVAHERRDFTAREQSEITDLMDGAKARKRQLDELMGQADLRNQIEGLGAGLHQTIGGRQGERTLATGATRTARTPRPGSWGQAFIGQVQRGLMDSLTPSGTLNVPSLTAGIVTIPDRPMSLLELIPTVTLTGTDQFSYLKEVTRTHNAAVVAPGELKPTSVYSVEKIDDRVRTIAHLTEPIPRTVLSDMALLSTYLDENLRAGVLLALEDQILNGSGAGEEWEGLSVVTGTQVQAWDTDVLTTLREAKTLLEVAHLEPSTYLLNPNDWQALDLLQDNENRYFFGGPGVAGTPRLWGLPVAVSTVVTAGQGYLLAADSIELYERERVIVDWSENVYDTIASASDFALNQVRFRAEGRFGLAVSRPSGVVEIDLTA